MDNAAPPRPLTFGAVILAAGNSTRMGRAKQFLEIEGKPLLLKAVEAALSSRSWPVIVVTGAEAERVHALLAPFPLLIAENTHWAEGMGTSVRTGISLLQQFSPSMDAAMLAVCDQPHFSRATIDAL